MHRYKFKIAGYDFDYLELLSKYSPESTSKIIRAYKSLEYLKEFGATTLYFEAETGDYRKERVYFSDWEGPDLEFPKGHSSVLEEFLRTINSPEGFWDEWDSRSLTIEIYLKKKPIIKFLWEEAIWNERDSIIDP